ncbi:MAG: hypothetical protein UX09_C0015G0016 [Candidatus Uhrbacteria bacterium GW2011_GWE2_45_35]|uniref:Uncharacterized protein n=2 Tax=Candidatus Uhriibacteriota TaxID=1752732 RepID=A0A0G1JHD5_9BACT|nr:MAG: hypothetical protein UW63_C0022G0011 [Candidatus Uhrbacteria bacterium GW2011_GWF2_44_350]KKU08629.1 MAG: hypothetical protein UX09_C0015G0016 [Candidatus Uhrbacteria bacterium GW2011_GWE2_45_35]HBR80915.1 hypothetical protein [Candidatus Uhrbacteria bacterium]HCU31231.1 hypothetical protein [Candidatus Uhrbacteria bacterium]
MVTVSVSEFLPFGGNIACKASICHPVNVGGYTLVGLLIALLIFVVFFFQKKISLKKYLISQIILFLIFSSTFFSTGAIFGCCGDPAPKRIINEIWSIFPDNFFPIFFGRLVWLVDFLDILDVIK